MATTQLGSQSVKLDKVRASEVDKVATCEIHNTLDRIIKISGKSLFRCLEASRQIFLY